MGFEIRSTGFDSLLYVKMKVEQRSQTYRYTCQKEKLNQRNYLVIQPSDIEPGFKLNSHSKTCVDFKTTCHNSKKKASHVR
ncbi:hypothetical protein CapIbe_001240 [Capra ibex]